MIKIHNWVSNIQQFSPLSLFTFASIISPTITTTTLHKTQNNLFLNKWRPYVNLVHHISSQRLDEEFHGSLTAEGNLFSGVEKEDPDQMWWTDNSVKLSTASPILSPHKHFLHFTHFKNSSPLYLTSSLLFLICFLPLSLKFLSCIYWNKIYWYNAADIEEIIKFLKLSEPFGENSSWFFYILSHITWIWKYI